MLELSQNIIGNVFLSLLCHPSFSVTVYPWTSLSSLTLILPMGTDQVAQHDLNKGYFERP